MQPRQQQIDALQAKGDHTKLASHAAIVWECVVCPQPLFKLHKTILNLPAKETMPNWLPLNLAFKDHMKVFIIVSIEEQLLPLSLPQPSILIENMH